MKPFVGPFLIIAAVAAGPGARGDEARPPADLAALLREAEAASPVIRAAAARLGAARRAPAQAAALPDPEVSIAYLNDGVSEVTLGESPMSNLAFTWSQEVPYPGKRGGREAIATREAERMSRDLERVRLEVAAAVKEAYADLYRFDQTTLVLSETRDVLESLAEAARRRYEVGEGIQESVLKAQTEILRLEAEMERVTQGRRTAEVRLNAAAGRAADTPIGPARSLPDADLPGDAEDLAGRAVARSPSVEALRSAVLREEAGVRLARLDLKPDLLWSVSYQNRDGLDPMVMGSFGLRLPIYRERKQRQAVLEREDDLLAVRQDLAAEEIRARAAVRDLVARFERADRLRTLYGQGIIPLARSALDSARAVYGVGRLGFLDLLNDLTVLLTARIDLAAQEADRLQALVALEPLVAEELVPVGAVVAFQGGRHEDND